MTVKVEKTPIGESTSYESCIGVREELPQEGNLTGFLGEEDTSERKEWEEHWVGMPEFVQEDNPPFKKLIVNFRNKEDYAEFVKLVGQVMTDKTKTIWYPELSKDENSLKRWMEE